MYEQCTQTVDVSTTRGLVMFILCDWAKLSCFPWLIIFYFYCESKAHHTKLVKLDMVLEVFPGVSMYHALVLALMWPHLALVFGPSLVSGSTFFLLQLHHVV